MLEEKPSLVRATTVRRGLSRVPAVQIGGFLMTSEVWCPVAASRSGRQGECSADGSSRTGDRSRSRLRTHVRSLTPRHLPLRSKSPVASAQVSCHLARCLYAFEQWCSR